MNIELKNIQKTFEKKVALKNITANFKPGAIYCVVGRNGAGKTTLFNSIMQLISLSGGKIFYNGLVHTTLPKKIKQKIGYLHQEFYVLEELTFAQFFKFISTLYNLDTLEAHSRIDSLKNVLFENPLEISNQRLSAFSVGMKKKVALIATLLHLPELLLLDEPFAGLDIVASNQIVEILKTYMVKPGRMVIVASHNFTYIEKLNPDRILIIQNGELTFSEDVKHLTNNGTVSIENALVQALGVTTHTINEQLEWL